MIWSTARHRGSLRMAGIVVLSALLPLLAGGCPEFRNGVVDSVESATRSVLLGSTDPEVAIEQASRGVLGAALELLFDQFRADDVRFR